jgi:hypothetical protein
MTKLIGDFKNPVKLEEHCSEKKKSASGGLLLAILSLWI